MKTIDEKLNLLKERLAESNPKIMIMGLGSVGSYLLDYLVSSNHEMDIYVVGRNREKMLSDANIVRISALIRHKNKSKITIVSNVDFNNVFDIEKCLNTYKPDIIVNSSRAYSGLKYGSISWNNIRAYGIWSPLSIRYIKNIMEAYENAECNSIVVNTSYSDAVIPWLKSAGRAYPDFGSGNINHLVPRIKFAVAEKCGILDFWNIDVTYAVSHFHDVVISKEGHCEGIEQLIDIRYNGKGINIDMEQIFSMCKIPMPVDAKRNMMNASSNFEIVQAILRAINGDKVKIHCPGAFGEIGGYPVVIDGEGDRIETYIDESFFSLTDMKAKNRESIYLDGVKNIEGGTLYFTDELIAKAKRAFGIKIMSKISFEEIEDAADFLINQVIEPNI